MDILIDRVVVGRDWYQIEADAAVAIYASLYARWGVDETMNRKEIFIQAQHQGRLYREMLESAASKGYI